MRNALPVVDKAPRRNDVLYTGHSYLQHASRATRRRARMRDVRVQNEARAAAGGGMAAVALDGLRAHG
jgi:hypothetical protein